MMMHGMPKKLTRSIGLPAVLAVVVFGILPVASAAPVVQPCVSSPKNRALNFWIGQWSISAPGGSPSATSTVSLDLDKCLVVERWDGGRGHTGENLFGYSADDESWHGLFADNAGRVHVFVDGKASTGLAQFSGPSRGANGENILNRVTIRRISENNVEQAWEKSSDGGKTWTIAFRGEYTRKQP